MPVLEWSKVSSAPVLAQIQDPATGALVPSLLVLALARIPATRLVVSSLLVLVLVRVHVGEPNLLSPLQPVVAPAKTLASVLLWFWQPVRA